MVADKEFLEDLKDRDVINHRISTERSDSTNKLLPKTFQPGKWDVLCCGGKEGAQHIGNKRYRVYIANNVTAYRNAKSKNQKSTFVSNIVASVKEASGDGLGGFVKKDPSTGRWYQVADKIAREKVSHALRDAIKVQKRKEARQRFINSIRSRHDSRSLPPKRRLCMQNDKLRMQRVVPESSIIPTSPDGCILQSHKNVCVVQEDDQGKGRCSVTNIFGSSLNCDEDWEKSLQESTEHFLKSDEENLFCTFL